MEFKNVQVDLNETTGILRLNRPDVKNALSPEMILEINLALDYFEKRTDIRFLILEGSGDTFCAGADLNWMKMAGEMPYEKNLEQSLLLAECFNKLYNSTKITIAKIIGSVYGGGIGLVASCDFSYSEIESFFSFSEVKLGLVPAIVTPYVIQKTGSSALRELMLTGSKISGEEAKRIGFINNCYENKEALSAGVKELIVTLSNTAPLAQREIKKLLNRFSVFHNDKNMIHETAELLTGIRTGAEAREGINAFLEKKVPGWIKY